MDAFFILICISTKSAILLLNHKYSLCCCGFCHCHGCRTKDALPNWSPAQQRSPENSLRPGFGRWSGGFERRSMVETELSMIPPVRWCKVELLLYLVSTGVLLTGFMDASTDSSAGHEGLRANKTATQSILSVLFRPIWFAHTKSDFPDPFCNVQSPSLLFHIESRFPRFSDSGNQRMMTWDTFANVSFLKGCYCWCWLVFPICHKHKQ